VSDWRSSNEPPEIVKPELSLSQLTFYADVNFLTDSSPAAELLRRARREGWVRLQVTDTVGVELPATGGGVPAARTASGLTPDELHALAREYTESYGPLVLGHSRLGSSVLGSKDDADRIAEVFAILKPKAEWSKTRNNHVRDALHLATAIRYAGDGFITRDQNVRKRADHIAGRFRDFAVLTPEDAYIRVASAAAGCIRTWDALADGRWRPTWIPPALAEKDTEVTQPASAGPLSELHLPPILAAPEEAANSVGDVVEDFGGDVLVAAGHADLGPAHHVHHGAGPDLEDQEHRRGGVAGVVEPGRADASRLE
jgi:hypothetical protein